jgi:hypothetical protein
MRKLASLFIFLVLWSHVAGAMSIITIKVNESGHALWVMEKQVPLTKPEINEWEAVIKAGQNISKYRDVLEFKDMINLFLRSAQNFSNRYMEVVDFNISYDTAETISGGFGIICYSFWWMNFSYMDSGKIFVGDAFSEGMLLSSDNLLVIEIPDGYDVKMASPNFDRRNGNRLIWEGSLHSFDKGEPSLVLQHTKSMLPLMVFSSVILVALVAAIGVLRKRRKSRYKVANDDTPIHTKETNAETSNANATLTSLLIPYYPKEEDLSDEKMIEQFLIRSGGQVYQSEIVTESRLSKSKVSIVLAKMKEDGRILKIKKGKENLIRLVDE